MDPSKLQSDTDNDVHSLEGTGSVVETDDATNDKSPATPPPAPRTSSIFSRIWQKLNIYILLFILLMLIAAAVMAVLFIKSRKEAPKSTLSSQNLSPDALKDLANSGVTIGNSKQILNVASNAVFSGSLLVRNSLEVAGGLKVGGELSLPGIVVSGASKFGQVQADTLAISGATNIQGTLTARRLNVNGEGTFNGNVTAPRISTNSLVLNGDLTLTSHITAGGPIPGVSKGNALGSGGTVSVSGSDTSGALTINTGSGAAAGCFATITFTKAFSNTPRVIITPIGGGAAGVNYYVNRSTGNMSICTTNSPPSGQSFGFDYLVLG